MFTRQHAKPRAHRGASHRGRLYRTARVVPCTASRARGPYLNVHNTNFPRCSFGSIYTHARGRARGRLATVVEGDTAAPLESAVSVEEPLKSQAYGLQRPSVHKCASTRRQNGLSSRPSSSSRPSRPSSSSRRPSSSSTSGGAGGRARGRPLGTAGGCARRARARGASARPPRS